jgi:hypothetical protein
MMKKTIRRKCNGLVSLSACTPAVVPFLTDILARAIYKIIPKIIAGTATPMKAPRQPKTAAIAAAVSGAIKKLALPPIACRPSARPVAPPGDNYPC